jgi:hypothetical protein
MQVKLPGLLVLEIARRDVEKKDSTGTYKATGEVANNIVFFPYGQSVKFGPPETIMMRIPDDQLTAVNSMIGKLVTCTADQRKGNKGDYYVFESMELCK